MSDQKNPPQVTIVGTGALACLIGARLASVASVTLTGSWVEGIRMLRACGIKVEDSAEITTVPVTAIPWGEATVPADLVLVLVKAWQTAKVAQLLERLLKPGGFALTLQNGLGNQETLGPRAGAGVTYQGAALLGPAHVQPGGEGATWIAGPEWVVELFQGAGMPAVRAGAAQMDSLMWGKLVVNCAINPLTAILRIPNGELLNRPDAGILMEHAARECTAVAHAKGVALPFSDPAEKAREVARRTACNRSSMLQDVLRGAPTECEAINGAVMRWGTRLGVPTPVNETLYRLVCSLASADEHPDKRNDRGSLKEGG